MVLRPFVLVLSECESAQCVCGCLYLHLRVWLHCVLCCTPLGLCAWDEQYVANNAVWCLGISGGAIVNVGYCAYLLQTRKTWGLFFAAKTSASPGTLALKNFVWSAIMGAVWFFGNIIYGLGAVAMGSSGSSLGWPVFMVSFPYAFCLHCARVVRAPMV
jgi:hypothetical protein